MSFRDELARVAAKDSRYTIDAYEFAFATIDHARRARARRARRTRGRLKKSGVLRHITGQDLCFAARDLALELYGRLALTVLERWGLRATSDLGNVVYNLIASGDLETDDRDRREDFDDVFDFATELRDGYALEFEESE